MTRIISTIFIFIVIASFWGSCSSSYNGSSPVPTITTLQNEASPIATLKVTTKKDRIITPTVNELAITGLATLQNSTITPTAKEYGYGIYAAYMGVEGSWYIFESGPSAVDSRTIAENDAGKIKGFSILYLGFAHFANQVAFWTDLTTNESGSLIASNLALDDPKTLFVDEDKQYADYEAGHFSYPDEEIKLLWSPDDRYLFIESRRNSNLNLIYDTKSDSIQEFRYICDRIALSPKSGKITLWCPSTEGQGFSVIEWGGEIWVQMEAPKEVIAQRSNDGQETWAFSAEGDQIAYYDTSDPEGVIVLSDIQGHTRLKLFQNSAEWIKAHKNPNNYYLFPPSPPLQWSENGTRLVVWGIGSSDHICPPYFTKGNVVEKVPCWQVVDASNGTTLWTVQDSIKDLVSGKIESEEIEPIDFKNPALSPDGRFLVIYSFSGIRKWSILDLNNKNEKLYGGNYFPDTARWGLVPDN